MAILECKDLSKRFGSVDALTDVSFAVEPGRIVGLLGPNGSGKTTLIKLVNGLLTPTSGQVLIDGVVPYFKKYVFHAASEARFTLASLGNDAGAYGAFKLALDAFGK